MPSGSRKRKSAKKTKQDVPTVTNGKPDEWQAESEENIENLVDPDEDNEEGPLTPKTPERDNESEKKDRTGMPTDEWLKASDQDAGIPNSEEETANGSDENHIASSLIPPVDWEPTGHSTTSDRPDDSANHPDSSIESILEDIAEKPGDHEYTDGLHFGDRTELDSSLKNRNSVDRAASLSTEVNLVEPIAESSGETLVDPGSVDFVVSAYADVERIEAPADEILLSSGSQDALAETSTGLEGESQQKIADLDATGLTLPAKDTSLSQEETSVRAVEVAREPSADLELDGQQDLAELDAISLTVSVDEIAVDSRHHNEISAATVETERETSADLEFEGQQRASHLVASSLTMPADESSVESKSQEEISTAAEAVETLGETCADPGLEGHEEVVEQDATPIPGLADEGSVQSSSQEESVTGVAGPPGETSVEHELMGRQEFAEADATPIPLVADESSVEVVSQEETSALAFEAVGEMSTDPELEGQQGATSLSGSVDENVAERRSQEEMSEVVEAPGESSADLELEGQQTVEGESSADLELDGKPEVMELNDTPVTVPTDESSAELESQDETSATAVEAPRKNNSDCEVKGQLEGSDTDATPLIVSADESSVEFKHQEEESVVGGEAPQEISLDTELKGKQEVLESNATPLTAPADETPAELMSQGVTSAVAVQDLGETPVGLDLDVQLSANDSLAELTSQEETLALNDSDTLLPESSQGESNSQGHSSGGGEITGADCEAVSLPEFPESKDRDSDERLFVNAEEINEVLGIQGEASSGNSEETEIVHSQEESQPPVPGLRADSNVEGEMFGDALQESADSVQGFTRTQELDVGQLKQPAGSQVNEVLGTQGEASAGNSEETELVRSQEESQPPGPDFKADSNGEGEILGDALPESAEAVQGFPRPQDLDVEQVKQPAGSQIDEVLGVQEEASASNSEEIEIVHSQEESQPPVPGFKADSNVEGEMFDDTFQDSAEAVQGFPRTGGLDVGQVKQPAGSQINEVLGTQWEASAGNSEEKELVHSQEESPPSVPDFKAGSNGEGEMIGDALPDSAEAVQGFPRPQELDVGQVKQPAGSQINEILETQGEAPAGNSEEIELLHSQEESQPPVSGFKADSNVEGEIIGDALQDRAEAVQGFPRTQELDVGQMKQPVGSQMNEVLGIQGEASPGNSEAKELVHSREESQSPVPDFEAHSNGEGEMLSDILPDSAEAVQGFPMPREVDVGQVKQPAGSQINEVLETQGEASAGISEEKEIVHSQEESQPPVLGFKADSNVEGDALPESAEAGQGLDVGQVKQTAGSQINKVLGTQREASARNSKETELVHSQEESQPPVPGFKADSNGEGEIPGDALPDSAEAVQGFPNTRELDVGQVKQPAARLQIHKTKWWECCGVFDAFLSRTRN